MRQIHLIYDYLFRSYGPQGWWPLLELGDITYKPGNKNYGGYHPGDYSYPKTKSQQFEICLGAILTQNTAWLNVVKALLNLKKQNMLNPDAIIAIEQHELANLIKPAGYFNQKAKKLKIFTEFYKTLNRKTPAREKLLSIWGIGPETADSMLLYAFKVPSFVIDAYTRRIFINLGFAKKNHTYDQVKALFETTINPNLKIYQEYHALIVEHAKRYYSKTSYPKLCPLYKCSLKLYNKNHLTGNSNPIT